MAVRIRARETETVLPKVVDQRSDYQISLDVASEHKGTLIEVERLPQLLNDSAFIKAIKDTESYRRDGSICFWTGTIGTNLNGYYRMNPQEKGLDEMFTFISEEFDSKVNAVFLDSIAHFRKGNQPLLVVVGREGRMSTTGPCTSAATPRLTVPLLRWWLSNNPQARLRLQRMPMAS